MTPNCNFCQDTHETINHIFIQCFHPQQYLKLIGMRHFISNLPLTIDPTQWLHKPINYKGIHIPHKVNTRTFLAISLWHIWITRNKNLYEHKEQALNPNHVLN